MPSIVPELTAAQIDLVRIRVSEGAPMISIHAELGLPGSENALRKQLRRRHGIIPNKLRADAGLPGVTPAPRPRKTETCCDCGTQFNCQRSKTGRCQPCQNKANVRLKREELREIRARHVVPKQRPAS